MGFLLAGLLQGAGAGITQLAQQRREDALISLRRQYQQEDQAAEDTRTIAAEGRALDAGLIKIGAAAEVQRRQGETEQAYKERMAKIEQGYKLDEISAKGKIDVSMEVLKSANNRLETREAKELEAKLRSGEVKDIRAREDGSMLVTYAMGRTEVRGEKLRDTRSSGGDEGETATERLLRERNARPQGTLTAKPKGNAQPAGKTYTQQDLQDTAAARGITVAQAKLLLEEVGYRPAG